MCLARALGVGKYEGKLRELFVRLGIVLNPGYLSFRDCPKELSIRAPCDLLSALFAFPVCL